MKCEAIGIWRMSERALTLVKEYYREDPSQAVVDGLKLIEDDETVHTVGRFSHSNINGVLQLDAAYMEGDSRVGAVIEASHIINPIEVARDLSHHRQNIVLAAEGADSYAEAHGFPTKEVLECLPYSKDNSHDTFGIILLHNDHFRLGVTTSGRNGKHAGRVGDSALTGAGYYCEDGVGACIATGDGEAVLRNALAKEVIDHMYYGSSPEEALRKAAERALKHLDYPADFCMIAMNKDGDFSAYSSGELFPFATLNNGEVTLHFVDNGIIYADDAFLDTHYHGD